VSTRKAFIFLGILKAHYMITHRTIHLRQNSMHMGKVTISDVINNLKYSVIRKVKSLNFH